MSETHTVSDVSTTAEVADAEDLRRENAALKQAVAEVRAKMSERLVFSELKAEAIRAGIIDVDGLRLLDLARISLDDDLRVQGAAELVQGLRVQKPWLFAGPSSSARVAAPPARETTPTRATEMSDAEYRAARAKLLRQHGF